MRHSGRCFIFSGKWHHYLCSGPFNDPFSNLIHWDITTLLLIRLCRISLQTRIMIILTATEDIWLFFSKGYLTTMASFNGIACEEYTAVCIDENNIGHAYDLNILIMRIMYIFCRWIARSRIRRKFVWMAYILPGIVIMQRWKWQGKWEPDDGADFDLNDQTAGKRLHRQNWWVDDGTLHIDDGMTVRIAMNWKLLGCRQNTLHFTLE